MGYQPVRLFLYIPWLGRLLHGAGSNYTTLEEIIMKIISIVNQKGGVGKTTTTLNLASGMAKLGKRVLVTDLDSQRNATTALNRGEYQGCSINDLIYFAVSGTPFDISYYIKHNELEDVDFIPAAPVLASAPGILATDKDSSMVLSRTFRSAYFSEKYDYILMDCKPSLDLLVINALAASDELIIPVEPEDFAVDGLADLWTTVERIRESFNEALAVNGILITKANMSRRKTQEAERQLRDVFGALVYLILHGYSANNKLYSIRSAEFYLPANTKIE